MITFAICDDDKEFANIFGKTLLREYKKQVSENEDVRCIYYANTQSIIERYDIDEVDVVFMDIEFGDALGMDVARELENKYYDINLVFITNHEEYAVNAFVCRPLSFIIKRKCL